MFAPVLARLRGEAAALTGWPAPRVVPVAVEARPFSNVARLGVATGDGPPTLYWFAKVQIPKDIPDAVEHMRARVRHEFDTTRKVEAALKQHPTLVTLQPVACYPELFAIVTQEVRGVTLLDYLACRVRWWDDGTALAEAEAAAGRTGEWLRAFQAIDPGDEAFVPAALREYVDLRLQRLVSSGRSPITASVRAQILHHIDALAAVTAPGEWRSVMRHADLAPGNVIVTAQGVAVLDFAMTSRGTRLHDLTRLSLQIDLLHGKPQFRRTALARVRAALHAGFDPAITESEPLFRLLTLLHRVNHLGTLTLGSTRGAARLYGWRLRRIHERSIVHELTMPVPEAPALPHGPRDERI